MRWLFTSLLSSALLAHSILAANILSNNGFTMCGGKSDITVQKLNIQYNKETNQVSFDVAGTSNKVQEVTATLTVTAYGQQVYKKDFDPCDNSTKVERLCPSTFCTSHLSYPIHPRHPLTNHLFQFHLEPTQPPETRPYLQNMPR
jgi:hypothetical protein